MADRPGLVRFGLRLAAHAWEADSTIAILEDGSIRGDGEVGLVEFILTDEPLVEALPTPQDEPRSLPAWGCVLVATILFSLISLVLIGLATVLMWIGAVIGR